MRISVVFAHGRTVLAYSPSGLTAKKLPTIAAPASGRFHAPDSIPKAAANWYEILTLPGVAIGGGNWFLDPGAYRAPQYVDLPDDLNFSDPAKDDYYHRHAVVVLPGLGTARSARTIAVPGPDPISPAFVSPPDITKLPRIAAPRGQDHPVKYD